MLLHQTFVKTEFLNGNNKDNGWFFSIYLAINGIVFSLIGSKKGTDASKVTIALLVLHLSWPLTIKVQATKGVVFFSFCRLLGCSLKLQKIIIFWEFII
jgi:hypothetical protein